MSGPANPALATGDQPDAGRDATADGGSARGAMPACRPAAQPHGTAPPASLLQSEALLQGRNSVEIAHLGAIYRLQTTRQGKLILTK